MHVIKDSIHKDILISDFEMNLIDSKDMQRLRKIKQLGPASLIYPSAVHTRFEHSVGVMALAGKVSTALNLEKQATEELKVAGLLHDIGHFPYSHIQRTEGIVKQEINKDHMDVSIEKIKNNLEGVLEKNSINVHNVCNLIKGQGKYGQILSSGIDIDKMDYLVRDAYFSGAAYGIIDLSRLLSTITFKNREFGFLMKGLKNVEAVVLSRYLMFSAVYMHETVEIATEMLGRSMQNLYDSGVLNAESLKTMDDIDITSIIRKQKEKTGLLLDERKLYKAIATVTAPELDKKTKKSCIRLSKTPGKLKSTEDNIANELGLKDSEFLIHISPKPKSVEKTKIFKNNRFLSLKRLSPLTKTLEEEQKNEWKIHLLSKKENKKLGRRAKKLFLQMI